MLRSELGEVCATLDLGLELIGLDECTVVSGFGSGGWMTERRSREGSNLSLVRDKNVGSLGRFGLCMHNGCMRTAPTLSWIDENDLSDAGARRTMPWRRKQRFGENGK